MSISFFLNHKAFLTEWPKFKKNKYDYLEASAVMRRTFKSREPKSKFKLNLASSLEGNVTDRRTNRRNGNVGTLRNSFWKFEVNPSSILGDVRTRFSDKNCGQNIIKIVFFMNLSPAAFFRVISVFSFAASNLSNIFCFLGQEFFSFSASSDFWFVLKLLRSWVLETLSFHFFTDLLIYW